MLNTGVRVGEAIHWYDNRLGLTYGIRPIDFALDEGKYGTLYVQSEKKRSVQPTRKIPIQSELKTALYEYMDRVRRYTGIQINSSSKDYLFPMGYSAVKKFIEEIGEETGITGIEYVKSKEKKGQFHKIHLFFGTEKHFNQFRCLCPCQLSKVNLPTGVEVFPDPNLVSLVHLKPDQIVQLLVSNGIRFNHPG